MSEAASLDELIKKLDPDERTNLIVGWAKSGDSRADEIKNFTSEVYEVLQTRYAQSGDVENLGYASLVAKYVGDKGRIKNYKSIIKSLSKNDFSSAIKTSKRSRENQLTFALYDQGIRHYENSPYRISWAVDLSKEALELAWQASDKQRVEHYKKKTADLYLETLDFRIENGVYTYVRKAFSKGLNFCEKEDLTSEALGFFNKFIDFCGEEFKQYKDKSSETQFINAGLEAARFCVSNNLVGKVVGYYLGALEHIDKEVTGIYAYDVAAKAAIEAARTFRNKEEFGGIVDHFYNLGIKLLEKNGSFETCLKIAQEFNDTPRINLFTALIS